MPTLADALELFAAAIAAGALAGAFFVTLALFYGRR
jgi:hypothetical protein